MFCHIVRVAPAFWLRVQDLADLSFTPSPLLKVSRVLVRLPRTRVSPFAVPETQSAFHLRER